MKKSFLPIIILSLAAVLLGCNPAEPPEQNTTEETETVINTDKIFPSETEDNTTENGNDQIFNVTENGITPNDPSAANVNSQKLKTLLQKLKKNSKVCFPEGDYYFNSLSYGCFPLSGLENVVFEGNNARIINSSYDPTIKKNTLSAGKSVTVSMNNCKNITFKGLDFDYSRYTQVCGQVVSVSAGRTIIRIDERFVNGKGKTPLTGKEYVMAVNVLDQDGNVIGDYYAPEDGFGTTLAGNMYSIEGTYGSEGDTVIARFTLGNYASPTFMVMSTSELRFENIRSYSSPTATFYATLGNENFTFDGFNIGPPENAEWAWGSNVDGIHIKGIRGSVTLKNSTFKGLGDDALNVHSVAPRVTAISDNGVSLEYHYGGKPETVWSREGDELEFYEQGFRRVATAKVKVAGAGKLTLDDVKGQIKEGCFVRNKSTCPELFIDNVTVDGGRARAFLIQSRTAVISNCDISNLGLAAIIVAPDIDYWGEMGPSERVEMRGLNIKNVCTMKNKTCLGAVLVSNSHSGRVSGDGPLHGTVKITDSTFSDTNSPALYAIYAEELEFSGNTLSGNASKPFWSDCTRVTVE